VRQSNDPPTLAWYFEDITIPVTGTSSGFAGTSVIADETTNVRHYSTRAVKQSMSLTQASGETSRYMDFYIPGCVAWTSGSKANKTTFRHNGKVYINLTGGATSQEPPHADWTEIGSWPDFTASDFEISYYVPPAKIDRWGTSAFNIFLLDSSNATLQFIAITKATLAEQANGGWFTTRVSLASGLTYASSNITLANINRVRVQLLTTNAASDDLMFVVDKIAFLPCREAAHYAYTADDCHANDYVIAQYLRSKGLRGTFACNGYNIDNPGATPRLTVAQMKEMQSWGMLFVNHGYNHYDPTHTDSTALDPHRSTAEMEYEISRGAKWLVDNGFSLGANIYVAANTHARWNLWTNDAGLILKNVDLFRGISTFAYGADIMPNEKLGNTKYVGPPWFGIVNSQAGQASKTISAVATASAGLATSITTSAAHGWLNGDMILISGQSARLNGLREVTYVSTTEVTIPVAYSAEDAVGAAIRETGCDAGITDVRLARRPLIVTGWHNSVASGYVTDGAITAALKAHIDRVAQKKAEGKLVDITLDQLVYPTRTEESGSSPSGVFGGSGVFGR
jgi:hypothetical protein